MASKMFPQGETIRLAMQEIPRFVLIDPKTEKFDGIFTPLANLVDDFFSGPGINRTLHPSTYGFGTFNHTSGKYSGILGMLQSNESDITFDLNVDFGLVQGNGVIRGQLMECEPPAIISGYNSITPTYPVDILVDTLADIGIIELSLFLFTIILCTMLLRARGYHAPIMSVVTYMLQKIPIQIRNYTTVCVCITLTITLFSLLLIFTSLLHINLVKVEMPIIVNDYQDIIDRLERILSEPSAPEFKVTWLEEYPDTELFRQGSLGSKEAKLWEASVKLRGPHFIYLRRDFTIFNDNVRNQSMVMILNQGYAHFVRNIICDINDANVNFHTWVSVDKDANWNQKGYLVRESLSGPLRTWTDERQMRILEAGMLIHFYELSKEMRIPQIDKTTRSNCSSDTIMVYNLHDDGDAALGNGPLKASYYTCGVLIVLCMIAFFGEKVIPSKELLRVHRPPHRKVRFEDILKIDI